MPRLNPQQFIDRHHELRTLWLQHAYEFSGLRVKEQWDLHRYYVPAENLTDEQLLERRAQITAADPSLPQRASKLYRALKRGTTQGVLVSQPAASGKHKGHQLILRTVARPKPNRTELMRLALDMAKENLERGQREAA